MPDAQSTDRGRVGVRERGRLHRSFGCVQARPFPLQVRFHERIPPLVQFQQSGAQWENRGNVWVSFKRNRPTVVFSRAVERPPMSRVYAIIIRSEPPRHGTFFRSAGLTGLRAGKNVNSRWRKLGRIFMATGQYPWMASHTQLPAVDPAEAGVLRILFATRDRDNRS